MLYLQRYLLFRILILIFKTCKYIIVKIDDKLFFYVNGQTQNGIKKYLDHILFIIACRFERRLTN